MFNIKKKLALAAMTSAAVWSTGASAAVNLDASPVVPATFASEVNVPSDGTLELTNTGNVLDVTFTSGFGFSEGTQVFVRIDISGGTITNTAPALTATNITGGTGTQSSGGLGQSFVIYSVTADQGGDGVLTGTGFPQTEAFTFAAPEITVTSNTGTATVTYGLYTDAVSAGNASGSVITKTGNLLQFGSAFAMAVGTTANANLTADVATNFTEFTPALTNAAGTLGSITTTDSGALSAGGVALTVATVCAAGSTTTVEGDYNLAINSTVTPNTFDTTDVRLAAGAAGTLTATTATFATGAALSTNAIFDIAVRLGSTNSIKESSYVASYNCTANNGFTAPTLSVALGSVVRNGTTVQIPYITTFADYNNRIVIVNRNSSDVPYNITFITESGVVATAGTAASGTLGANSTTVIRATDVVTLAGGTRTAATLTAVAQGTSIDVATTQVNLSDASTDTVDHQ